MQIPEAIRFKNRFRILYHGKVLALNSITNSNGNSQFVQGFETLQEAIDTRRIYAGIRGVHEEDLSIESYSENTRHLVPGFSMEVNKELERRKVFSGKGLRFKNWENRHDNKYQPGKYYGPEVGLAQSAERSKGMSIISKVKEKKDRARAGASKLTGMGPSGMYFSSMADHGAMTLGYSLVDSLRKKELGRKALRKYLRAAGYTVRQSIEIGIKVFDKDN